VAEEMFPEWIKVNWTLTPRFGRVRRCLEAADLPTVCESARCPNRVECWSRGTATFMILGDCCTRNCRFCSVKHGLPEPVRPDEPERVARAVGELGLRYAVVTSVTRDDLPDGGAGQFAATVREIRRLNPGVRVEVLVPDFRGNREAVRTVVEARPHVFAHNVETVRRLQPEIRPQASYETSLAVLRMAAEASGAGGPAVKSGLMVGLGETTAEVVETLEDLRRAGCVMVTVGQYLQADRQCLPVRRFVPPEEFGYYERVALDLGFKSVASGPLVRSSYLAEHYFDRLREAER